MSLSLPQISFTFPYSDSCLPDIYWTKANSIVPDVTPQNAVSNLGLFCLLRGISSEKK